MPDDLHHDAESPSPSSSTPHRKPRELRRATFSHRAVVYHTASATLAPTLVFLLAVGLTLVPLGVISLVFLIGPMLVFFVARWYYALYFRKLECVLTERKLHVGKGLLFRTEKAIPLDKVTDLSMNQGPLLRWMNLEAMGVETAGQSNAQGGALVRLVGIEGSRDFREAVLDQRDRVVGTADAHGATSERGAGVGTDAATGTRSTDDESVALLREIRDSLRRIEGRADRAAPNEPMAKLQE